MERMFIALPSFLRDWKAAGIGEDELRWLEDALLVNPKAGAVVTGSGGIRKIRWARPGMGKSGGVRVFYYDWEDRGRLYFIALLSKSEAENLKKREISILSKIVEKIVEE